MHVNRPLNVTLFEHIFLTSVQQKSILENASDQSRTRRSKLRVGSTTVTRGVNVQQWSQMAKNWMADGCGCCWASIWESTLPRTRPNTSNTVVTIRWQQLDMQENLKAKNVLTLDAAFWAKWSIICAREAYAPKYTYHYIAMQVNRCNLVAAKETINITWHWSRNVMEIWQVTWMAFLFNA